MGCPSGDKSEGSTDHYPMLTTTQCVQPVVIGGLLDDEDDDVGIADDDVLVMLNYEAFQKMNVCAHLISPAPRGSPLENDISNIHPTLT
jgi:hypothetical protein